MPTTLADIVAATPPRVRVTNAHGTAYTLLAVEDVPCHPTPERCAILLDSDGAEYAIPVTALLREFRAVSE